MLETRHKLHRREVSPRKGMALYMVLAVVLIMGLMMPIYFSFSRQLSSTSFSKLNEERLASLNKIVHDATFAYLRAASQDPEHKIFKFLKDSVTSAGIKEMKNLEKDSELLEIVKVAIPKEVSIDGFRFRINAKIYDQETKNAQGDNYYPGEGLASIEINVTSSLFRGSSFLASCSHTRNYDYKSVCLVAYEKDKYSMGFPLAYTLFVRDGKAESGTSGANLRYSVPDQSIKLTNNAGDVFIGITTKITTQGNYLSTAPDVYNFKNSKLSNVFQKGSSGFRPFRNCTLYAARFNGAKAFEKSGIYNQKTGELRLPGLVDIQKDHLNLKKPANGGKIKVFGKGGLLVPEGITINSGIELNDKNKDLCVFFTRKRTINVKTTDTIEAALLAFGDNSTLNSGIKSYVQNFKIFGCLGVDRLFAHSNGLKCEIDYDKRFKANSKQDEIFILSLIPWIRFENKEFSKKDLLK